MSEQVTRKLGIMVRDVEGWPLAFLEGGDRILISELDLGTKLRYARNDSAIQTVDRMVLAGKFNESEFLHTPWENKPGRGRPRKSTNGGMRWLTEEQALLVATQSDTPVAWDITREMVRVFSLARRGLLPQQQPRIIDEASIATFADRLAEIVTAKVLAKLDEKPVTGTVGDNGGNEIRRKLRRYAYLMAGSGEPKDVKSWRSSGDMELRAELKHIGSGTSWNELSVDKLPDARRRLGEMINRATRVACDRAAAMQMELPIPPSPKAA